MKSESNRQRRFSLLYLEDQEINTNIYKGCLEMKDSITQKKIKENGVFYINSKSFIFEPIDPAVPLYKFLFINFTKNKGYNLPGCSDQLIKCPKKMKYYSSGILQFQTKKIFEIKVSLIQI